MLAHHISSSVTAQQQSAVSIGSRRRKEETGTVRKRNKETDALCFVLKSLKGHVLNGLQLVVLLKDDRTLGDGVLG